MFGLQAKAPAMGAAKERGAAASRLMAVGSALALSAALAVWSAAPAGAQQPAPTQPSTQQPRPAPAQGTQAPRPAQPPAAQQRPQGQGQGQPAQQQAAPEPQSMPVNTTPWTKVCEQIPNQNKQGCQTTMVLTTEAGQFLMQAALREIEGDPKKELALALPLGMLLQPGLRIVIDQQPPINARYDACLPNGCFASTEVTADLMNRLKRGQALVVQMVNLAGRTVSFTVPLRDFGKTVEGPGLDRKAAEEQQRKFQEEMEARAQRVREQLLQRQGGQPGAPAPGAPAAPGQPPRQ
jgi:invasion protein IalB